MGPCHPPHPMLCPGGEQVAGRWPPAASHTRALGISRGEEAEVPSPVPALPDVPAGGEGVQGVGRGPGAQDPQV